MKTASQIKAIRVLKDKKGQIVFISKGCVYYTHQTEALVDTTPDGWYACIGYETTPEEKIVEYLAKEDIYPI